MEFVINNRANITQLVHTAFRKQLYEPKPHAVLHIETHMFNAMLQANSCQYDIDLGKEIWLNKSRWTRLTREYIAQDKLAVFLEGARLIYQGEARDGACVNMQFRDPPRKAKKHRWGGCLMGATFRGNNKRRSGPATITFYSRTTYMGYMGMVDACIANVMAREITGDASLVQFRWLISSCQLHCFKSLPFMYSQTDLMDELENGHTESPTLTVIRRWYATLLKHYDQYGIDMVAAEKYGPFKRIKRRWLEYKGLLTKGVPPSVKPFQLDFTKSDQVDDEEPEENDDED